MSGAPHPRIQRRREKRFGIAADAAARRTFLCRVPPKLETAARLTPGGGFFVQAANLQLAFHGGCEDSTFPAGAPKSGPMGRRVSKQQPRWRVIRIVGKAAREICELQAADAKAAVKRTIREFGITDPAQQRRLAARRVT